MVGNFASLLGGVASGSLSVPSIGAFGQHITSEGNYAGPATDAAIAGIGAMHGLSAPECFGASAQDMGFLAGTRDQPSGFIGMLDLATQMAAPNFGGAASGTSWGGFNIGDMTMAGVTPDAWGAINNAINMGSWDSGADGAATAAAGPAVAADGRAQFGRERQRRPSVRRVARERQQLVIAGLAGGRARGVMDHDSGDPRGRTVTEGRAAYEASSFASPRSGGAQ